MTNYLGITLGPIYATLQEARSTKEIWAASYLFSRLTELLLDALPGIGAAVIVPKKVGIPIDQRLGTGIYNDRIFASLPDNAKDKVAALIGQTIEQLALELAPDGQTPKPDFWKQYLRVAWVCKPLASLDNGALFGEIGPLLDAQELHTPYSKDGSDASELTVLLDNIYDTQLANTALQSAKGSLSGIMTGLFPSTVDLGTLELYQRDRTSYKKVQGKERKSKKEADEVSELYDLIFADPAFKHLATDYHKYFCIVHADGDNLSELNKTLDNEKAYRDLSDQLSQFALEAAAIVDQFGGKTVFAGGDDLLFFAPVCVYDAKTEKTKSIFQLIKELDERFNKLGFNGTSLSFGITLTYQKFPLFEARQLSYEQLNDVAKQATWRRGGNKNAIAVRLLKHSGAWFEGVLSKNVLAALVLAETELRHSKDDLLSGIIYKMETLEPLINTLPNGPEAAGRISALFANFFNEPIHRRNATQLTLVQKLVEQILADPFTVKNATPDSARNNVYALLRLLQFVTARPQTSAQQKSKHHAATTQDI